MTKEKPVEISTLNDFIDWIIQLGSDNYWFRGVPNEDYRIQASAFRRLNENQEIHEESTDSFISDFQLNKDRVEKNRKVLQINSDLIADARLQGHDKRDGRTLEDLEILAEFQHFFAATCLIDFTHNAQIALYFACQKDLKLEKDSTENIVDPNGKVYAVRNDPNRFKKVNSTLLEKEIDEFSQFNMTDSPQLYYWEPRHQNNRVIAQQSIFLFGSYEFMENDMCIINAKKKDLILTELKHASGITQEMLFPDFDGFARLYREDIPYTRLTAYEYASRAYNAYQTDKHEKAIEDYDRAIEMEPDKSSYHYNRANAKAELRQYSEAIKDYDQAIELYPDDADYYYYRARARKEIRQNPKAIEDLDKAIELKPDYSRFYSIRGQLKVTIGQSEQAIIDFSKALDREPKNVYTYYHRAIAKIDIEDFSSAEKDLEVALIIAKELGEDKLITSINEKLLEIEKTNDDIPF